MSIFHHFSLKSERVLSVSLLGFQAKMGFREGEGLGKFGQGRKEIIEASTQRGRRGLGLTLQGFQGVLNIDWQDEPEVGAQRPGYVTYVFMCYVC